MRPSIFGRRTRFPRLSIHLRSSGAHHLRGWRPSAASNAPPARHFESWRNSTRLSDTGANSFKEAPRKLLITLDWRETQKTPIRSQTRPDFLAGMAPPRGHRHFRKLEPFGLLPHPTGGRMRETQPVLAVPKTWIRARPGSSHWYRRYKTDVISCPVAATIVREMCR
jgi:hypothetical protein